MCQHQTTKADSGDRNSKTDVLKADLSQHSTGSRQRRLWELPVSAHCPVVGICIPAELLRKSLRKVIDADLIVSDYDFHIGTVGHARTRNPISDILQKLLEQRFAFTIRLFHTAKTQEGLAELWIAAIRSGDVAGPFWAALTHPQCNEKMQAALIHDMHLLQHQACAMFRTNTKDMQALEQHNIALTTAQRQTEKRCERLRRQSATKSAHIADLQQQLSTSHSALRAKEEKACTLESYLATILALVPEMDSYSTLQDAFSTAEQRNRDYEKQILALEHQLERQATQRADTGIDPMQWAAIEQRSFEDARHGQAALEPVAATTQHMQLRLTAKQVLCVGGRAGKVPDYRDIIEKAGALFAHHDGGIKDKERLLEASLAAADMVICQTGCISHNAYWRVKDFCKRTGKQCVYVDNPSTASLIRELKTVTSIVPDWETG